MEHLKEVIFAFSKDLVWCMICIWHIFISTLPTIVLLLGLIYVCLQITYIVWKWRIEKSDRDKLK